MDLAFALDRGAHGGGGAVLSAAVSGAGLSEEIAKLLKSGLRALLVLLCAAGLATPDVAGPLSLCLGLARVSATE